ncbi:MAG: S1C family serine protease [Betaproteobacteria bacterium]
MKTGLANSVVANVGRWTLLLLILVAPAIDAAPNIPPAINPPDKTAVTESGVDRLAQAVNAVIKVKVKAVPNARSLATLGAQREGSGIIVGPNGLVLTIGYLIVEAESVELEDNAGKVVPASVVAYDHASGFGLVRSLAPLAIAPVELGDSAKLGESDSAIFAAAGGIDAASSTTVVSRRRFAGYWEYMIEDAIFTSPPRFDHSGAALIDKSGALVGVGSLIVADSSASPRRLPGNMFVPINLLKPILSELLQSGSSHRGRHPWLGITSQEVEGRVFVSKVQADGPAERAGLRSGDILLAVGGTKIAKLEELYAAIWKGAQPGDEVTLTVLQGAEVKQIVVKSMDRSDYMRTKSRV